MTPEKEPKGIIDSAAEDQAEPTNAQAAEGPDAEGPAEDKAEGGQEEAADSQDAEGSTEDSAEGGQEEQPNVTPEEQKMYDSVMTAALNALYDKNQIGIIIRKLSVGKDNISATIGHSAAMIMTSLQRTAQARGKQIPDDVLYAVGQDVIGELCNIAVGAKIMPQAQVTQVANAALYEGMRVWGQSMQQSGGMTPDKVAQAKQDLADKGITQQQPAQGAPQGQPPGGAPPPAQAPAGPPPAGIVNQAAQPPAGA